MDNVKSLYANMRLSFLYVDNYSFSGTWIYPRNHVPYCMLRYIVKGSAVFHINNELLTVHADDIVYIPEGCELECHALSGGVQFISVRFATSIQLDGADFLHEYFHINRVTKCAAPVVSEYFVEMYKSALSQNLGKSFRIRGNLELIMAYLVENSVNAVIDPAALHALENAQFSVDAIRQRVKRSSDVRRDPRIQIVLDYLVHHPTEPFNTDFLADMISVSASSLRRLFKASTGKSLGDFVNELRMMTAARRLLVTEDRISAIAYDTGFDDPNYFARSFKSTFGVSPRQYRSASREL